jgi:hypothetical protein
MARLTVIWPKSTLLTGSSKLINPTKNLGRHKHTHPFTHPPVSSWLPPGGRGRGSRLPAAGSVPEAFVVEEDKEEETRRRSTCESPVTLTSNASIRSRWRIPDSRRGGAGGGDGRWRARQEGERGGRPPQEEEAHGPAELRPLAPYWGRSAASAFSQTPPARWRDLPPPARCAWHAVVVEGAGKGGGGPAGVGEDQRRQGRRRGWGGPEEAGEAGRREEAGETVGRDEWEEREYLSMSVGRVGTAKWGWRWGSYWRLYSSIWLLILKVRDEIRGLLWTVLATRERGACRCEERSPSPQSIIDEGRSRGASSTDEERVEGSSAPATRRRHGSFRQATTHGDDEHLPPHI